ncbi:KH homology domain-containing protein 4 isoform X2 [Hydra vulgaris]|uniref:KH homology domain-containing protein 4 isoform X2 n=1 Tax=Hydra vulgaris TaxID=6087 RepID=UPI001F5F4FDB|nr:KH homology domain-containing protein 4 isoform X2 [Hydra vulgaris]
MAEVDIPVFKEGTEYESWRSEVLKWQLFTTMEPRRQALAVRAKLGGSLRDCALMIDAGELFCDDGLGVLIGKLDKEFRVKKSSTNRILDEDTNYLLKSIWVADSSSDDNYTHSSKVSSDSRSKTRRSRFDVVPSKESSPIRSSRSRFDYKSNSPVEHKSRFDQKFDDERESNQYDQSFEDDRRGCNQHNQRKETEELSAAEKARQRAAQLSAKLVAEGKYQTKPTSLLPSSVWSPAEQIRRNNSIEMQGPKVPLINATQTRSIPEVKKMDNGGYYAEFDINDISARVFLTKSSSQDLIGRQSGALLSLRGRYLSADDKRKLNLFGTSEKPLTLMIHADVAAKVQVAVHKVQQVIDNCEKHGYNGLASNYGLTASVQQTTHHFIQDKVFVGLTNVHPDFPLNERITGVDNSNFNFIIQQTSAKVFLRGQGSGYLEQNSGKESFEALHIYISHTQKEGLNTTRSLCSSLIDTVKRDYNEWQHLRSINQPTVVKHSQMSEVLPWDVASSKQSLIYQQQFQSYPPNNSYPLQNSLQNPLQSSLQSTAYQPSVYNMLGFNSTPDKNVENEEKEKENKDKSHSSSQNRSPRHRRRSKSRSRSPKKNQEINKKSSPDKSSSPPKSKRKFTEEPKKKRKFSEDPQVIQKYKENNSTPKLQFRSAKKENGNKVDTVMPPPVLPPPSALPPPSTVPAKIARNKSNDTSKTSDVFKVPPPINTLSVTPKALKMGALSTIAIYSDDSDDET